MGLRGGPLSSRAGVSRCCVGRLPLQGRRHSVGCQKGARRRLPFAYAVRVFFIHFGVAALTQIIVQVAGGVGWASYREDLIVGPDQLASGKGNRRNRSERAWTDPVRYMLLSSRIEFKWPPADHAKYWAQGWNLGQCKYMQVDLNTLKYVEFLLRMKDRLPYRALNRHFPENSIDCEQPKKKKKRKKIAATR